MSHYTGEYRPRKVVISVSNGVSGSTSVNAGGIVLRTAIKPPTPGASYIFEILDRDADGPFGIMGVEKVGSATIVDRYQLDPADGQTFTIYSSTNGTYTVKLTWDAYGK